MFFAKFIKNLDHYIYYPGDLLLVPCSIMFGWFHGLIKIYSLLTINVVRTNYAQSPGFDGVVTLYKSGDADVLTLA